MGAWSAETFTNLGIVITATLGVAGFLYTLKNNRRASYVGIISDARLAWIEAFRTDVGTLLALAHRWIHAQPTQPADAADLWQKIVESVFRTRLHLTPKARGNAKDTASPAYFDNQIDALIASFFNALAIRDAARADECAARLLRDSQELIWDGWLKTKRESVDGDPHDTFYHRWKRRLSAWWERLRNAAA